MSSAPRSTNPVGSAAAAPSTVANSASSVTAVKATRSVHSRWAIWWAMVQPGAGVAFRPALGGQLGDQLVELVAFGA